MEIKKVIIILQLNNGKFGKLTFSDQQLYLLKSFYLFVKVNIYNFLNKKTINLIKKQYYL